MDGRDYGKDKRAHVTSRSDNTLKRVRLRLPLVRARTLEHSEEMESNTDNSYLSSVCVRMCVGVRVRACARACV